MMLKKDAHTYDSQKFCLVSRFWDTAKVLIVL